MLHVDKDHSQCFYMNTVKLSLLLMSVSNVPSNCEYVVLAMSMMIVVNGWKLVSLDGTIQKRPDEVLWLD